MIKNKIIELSLKLLIIGLFIVTPVTGYFTQNTYSYYAMNNNITQVPSYVQIGDILFCEWKHYNTDPCWDHAALYIGDDYFIEATPVGEGVVRIIHYEWFVKYTKDICFGTVINNDESIRNEAISFAYSQLGKPYQYLDWQKLLLNRTKDPSADADAWYCTELIWAAYYNQGIELDLKGMHVGPVMPAEICWDNDIEMYTQHMLNSWHIGMYFNWILYILQNPRNLCLS